MEQTKKRKSGEEKDHLFERVKPKNSKSPKSPQKRPREEEKKESTTVCTLTNSYSSRRADLTR